jgi:hypothetical protein
LDRWQILPSLVLAPKDAPGHARRLRGLFREVTMTLAEALTQIEEFGRACNSAPVTQKEASCPQTQAAIQILAAAYQSVRKLDPLYGERRRAGTLLPPPARVPPG